MNRYPLWKYLIVLIMLALATVFVLPNVYLEQPAIQVSSVLESAPVDEALMDKVNLTLAEKNIIQDGSFLDGNALRVRLPDTDTQFKAQSIVAGLLGDKYSVSLSRLSTAPNWLMKMGAKPMVLGLDLQGGAHFLMEVDMAAASEKALDRYAGEARRHLKEAKIRYDKIRREGNRVSIRLKDPLSVAEAEKRLAEKMPSVKFVPDSAGSGLQLIITPEEMKQIQADALKQNMITLHNRVNKLGTTEPIIQQSGENRIVVQMPGLQDTAKAKDILGRTAALEVHLVEDDPDMLAQAEAGNVPSGYLLATEERQGNQVPILLKSDVELTGDNINKASAGYTGDQTKAQEPAVFISLDSLGTEIFRQLTAENINKRMAMVLVEGGKLEVVTAPNINQEIGGGNVSITGSMTLPQANDVALLLGSGSLAAPMQIIEERTVGPSLGAENLKSGLHATLWGFVAIAIFMVIYYRFFGVISVLSLGANVLFLLSLLSLLQATLTMPGIAAIALTLGMAIDSNVLINERIREELAKGLSPHAAINEGYKHAWATIVDSNITALVVGLALLNGSGPVKGFAVVHCLGILTSMLSAVLVSRALVSLSYGRRRVTSLSI